MFLVLILDISAEKTNNHDFILGAFPEVGELAGAYGVFN